MVEFKACPRCRGDLHAAGDVYGEYATCLQCGYVADRVKTSAENEAAASPEKAPGRGRGGGRKVA